MSIQPLLKPSQYQRLVSKWEAKVRREGVKKAETRKEQRAWAELSAKVQARDKSTCRVCSCQTTPWGKGHPKYWTQVHHIVYRSAGGADSLQNCIVLCGLCHQAEHEHRLSITGTSDALVVTGRREVE